MDTPSPVPTGRRRRKGKDVKPRVQRTQPPRRTNSKRPDPFYWPTLTHAEAKKIATLLRGYKLRMSDYRNNYWLEFRDFDHSACPLQERPISNAFIYGMTECCNAVNTGGCWAVIVEAKVSPRSIILPIIEECVINNIPMVCLTQLRNISAKNFGIYTGCLGIKRGCSPEIMEEILAISNSYKVKQLELKNSQSEPVPEVREPSEIIVENLFDLNQVDESYNVVVSTHDRDEPSTSYGVPRSRAHCSHTVTSESSDVLPSLSQFKMVLKKSARHAEKAAWLDIDMMQIVVMPE